MAMTFEKVIREKGSVSDASEFFTGRIHTECFSKSSLPARLSSGLPTGIDSIVAYPASRMCHGAASLLVFQVDLFYEVVCFTFHQRTTLSGGSGTRTRICLLLYRLSYPAEAREGLEPPNLQIKTKPIRSQQHIASQ